MVCDEFPDITPLANALTKRTITTDKVKIDYRKVHQLRTSHDDPQNLQVKLSHDDGEEWKQISLKKRGVNMQDNAMCLLCMFFYFFSSILKYGIGPCY